LERSRIKEALDYICGNLGTTIEVILLENNKYKIGDIKIFNKFQFQDYILELSNKNGSIKSVNGYNSREFYIIMKNDTEYTIQVSDMEISKKLDFEE